MFWGMTSRMELLLAGGLPALVQRLEEGCPHDRPTVCGWSHPGACHRTEGASSGHPTGTATHVCSQVTARHALLVVLKGKGQVCNAAGSCSELRDQGCLITTT